jgi:16S rRNA (cytosine967-C5)-methyltransferase
LGFSLQQPAPLDLAGEHYSSPSALKCLKHLVQEGIEAHATPYSPCGIRLASESLRSTAIALFLSGKIEVQDEGSQLLGYLLAPKRGEMVVDFCAGAGGKSLLLGALMNSKGRLYAFDVSEKRLSNLKPRFKRSGLSNLHTHSASRMRMTLKIKRLIGKIDRVSGRRAMQRSWYLAAQPGFKVAPIRAEHSKN